MTGCSKISAGCKRCYAERMAHRLAAMGQRRYRNGFRVTLQSDLLDVPLRWREPRTVFVNSMSDLFHEEIPEPFIRRVFEAMCRAHWHTFQILTKRSRRLADLAPTLTWPENVWMGVTVESPRYLDRIRDLQRFLLPFVFSRLNRFWLPFPDYLSLASTGLSSAVNRGRVAVAWNRNGSAKFEIVVLNMGSLSFSNDGEASGRNVQVGDLTEKHGMNCRDAQFVECLR